VQLLSQFLRKLNITSYSDIHWDWKLNINVIFWKNVKQHSLVIKLQFE